MSEMRLIRIYGSRCRGLALYIIEFFGGIFVVLVKSLKAAPHDKANKEGLCRVPVIESDLSVNHVSLD